MTKSDRVRYEMFLRVRDFGTAHRDRFPESSRGGELFDKLARAAAAIETQAKVRLQAAHDGRKNQTAARTAVVKWMRDISKASRDVARTTGSRGQLRMPGKTGGIHLLSTARMFLDTARPIGPQLVGLGVDANWETAFNAAIDTFEASLGDTRAGRHGVVSARAAIAAALVEGFDAVRSLDVLVAIALKDDLVLMPAWLRSRRIVGAWRKGDVEIVPSPTGPQPTAAPPLAPSSLPASPSAEPGQIADDELKKAS